MAKIWWPTSTASSSSNDRLPIHTHCNPLSAIPRKQCSRRGCSSWWKKHCRSGSPPAGPVSHTTSTLHVWQATNAAFITDHLSPRARLMDRLLKAIVQNHARKDQLPDRPLSSHQINQGNACNAKRISKQVLCSGWGLTSTDTRVKHSLRPVCYQCGVGFSQLLGTWGLINKIIAEWSPRPCYQWYEPLRLAWYKMRKGC